VKRLKKVFYVKAGNPLANIFIDVKLFF
jgi:hypothetical protein